MTRHLISAGARRIGFIGDTDHCNSFHERWIGFVSALADAGLTLDRNICILDKDGPQCAVVEPALSCAHPLPAVHNHKDQNASRNCRLAF